MLSKSRSPQQIKTEAEAGQRIIDSALCNAEAFILDELSGRNPLVVSATVRGLNELFESLPSKFKWESRLKKVTISAVGEANIVKNKIDEVIQGIRSGSEEIGSDDLDNSLRAKVREWLEEAIEFLGSPEGAYQEAECNTIKLAYEQATLAEYFLNERDGDEMLSAAIYAAGQVSSSGLSLTVFMRQDWEQAIKGIAIHLEDPIDFDCPYVIWRGKDEAPNLDDQFERVDFVRHLFCKSRASFICNHIKEDVGIMDPYLTDKKLGVFPIWSSQIFLGGLVVILKDGPSSQMKIKDLMPLQYVADSLGKALSWSAVEIDAGKEDDGLSAC